MIKVCFTKRSIDSLTNNIVERSKVSSIKILFDNLKCVSNPWNAKFSESTFYGNQRLITRQQIYCINDNIVEILNNILIIDVYTKLIQEE